MPQAQEVASWIGWEVVDVSGDKIGKLEAIYLDAETDQPEWALIKTGLFGGRSPLVPLQGAESEGETVRVNFPKDQVKDAPSVKANEELSQQEEAQLYQHYGLEYSFVPSGSGMGEGGAAGAAGAGGAAGTESAAGSDQTQGAGGVGTQGTGADATQAAGEPGAGADASQTTGEPGDASQASGSQGAGTEATAAGVAAAGSGGAPTQTGSAGDAPGTPGSAGTQPGSGGDAAAAEGAAAGDAGTPSAGGPSGRVQEAAEGQPSEVIRLRKYIITEHVPVQHEEVRVEREPVDESNEAN